eukprot:480073-Prymnesium_polylepis.1
MRRLRAPAPPTKEVDVWQNKSAGGATCQRPNEYHLECCAVHTLYPRTGTPISYSSHERLV